MPSDRSFVPFARMKDRLSRAANDSDTTHFYDLILAGELILKVTVAGLIASIRRDPAAHRYRLEAGLVRADGLGEWLSALDETLIGPASEYTAEGAQEARRQLTETVVPPDWRKGVLDDIEVAASVISSVRPGYRRAQLRQFFHTLVWIRNKTRGHGAPDLEAAARMAQPLSSAIGAMMDQLLIAQWPWAVIRRGMSGRFRVTPLGGSLSPSLEELRQRTDLSYDDGVYIGLGSPMRVGLAYSDVDISDFFLANGSFTDSEYELLSYSSGECHKLPSSPYRNLPAPLPTSETRGNPEVTVRRGVLTNMPERPSGYVRRMDLEEAVTALLMDPRRTVITLSGRGGIGKTSLALQVLDEIAGSERFSNIWWFSARDIDLLPVGPKQVKPDVLTLDDIAKDFARMVALDSEAPRIPTADAKRQLMEWLSGSARGGPSLFVFDNFETVSDPSDVHLWLDDCIRAPNKILITTRVRDFKGDYPVEVQGMTEAEFRELAQTVSRQLGIESLVTDGYIDELFTDTDGHPYVLKILLGEVARTGRRATAERIMADRDEILTALFERTFAASLTHGARRVFLTLCGWRSVVPEIALKAALLRPGNERMDVSSAVDELIRSSMVESILGGDNERFLSVPLAAQLFGRSKLRVVAERASIEADLAILRSFGPAQEADAAKGLAPRMAAFMRAAEEDLDTMRPILEYAADHFPPLWMQLADMYSRMRDAESERSAVLHYVQRRPLDPVGWRRLARIDFLRNDVMGEMHALLQLSELPAVGFREISDTANRFNQLSANKRLDDDRPAQAILSNRIRAAMEARVGEADATDLSRLGWLCYHQGDVIRAREYARRGLIMEPDNRYCQTLLDRL